MHGPCTGRAHRHAGHTADGFAAVLLPAPVPCRLDGRKYAVKKIRLQPGGSSSSYSRILREVATLSRLQHPNVVRYYQVGHENQDRQACALHRHV